MTAAGLDPDARRGLEAILFLADEPVDVATLAEVLEADVADVESELERLAATFRRDGRGMEIRAAAGGWRMYTAAESKPVVERWALAGRTGRLTQAALETLAVIAYKQPISRHQIGEIRGVNADAAVRSLVARGLVAEIGRDPGPGQAVLYGTTPTLLERLGLDSLDELPPLTDFLPDAPAPDEPDLGALKEVRRRLSRGGDLAVGGLRERAGRSVAPGVDALAGGDVDGDDDGDDDLLPPPAVASARPDDGEEMDALTERLEAAARKAVDRLRAAVAADGIGSSDETASGAEVAHRDPDRASDDDDPDRAADDGDPDRASDDVDEGRDPARGPDEDRDDDPDDDPGGGVHG